MPSRHAKPPVHLLEQPPSGLRVTPLAVGDETLWVFSHPLPRGGLADLSAGERDVAQLLLAGLSNAEIARHRGTAPGTVGKQIDSIYRKLNVHGRRELAAVMTSLSSVP